MSISPERRAMAREVPMNRKRDVDVLLAVLVFASLLVNPVVDGRAADVTPLAGCLALLASAPLAARRRAPVGVLAVVVPLLLASLAVFHPNQVAVGVVMLLVFTVGEQGDRVRSLVVGALMAPVVTAAVLVTGQRSSVSDVIGFSALVLGALATGTAVGARHALQRAQDEELERERDARAQHRLDEQRLRLAHELHDIIGHALVAINVRASAAAHLERHRGKTCAPAVLEEIASTSAEALAELRSALTGLRVAPTEPAPMESAQALEDLRELVAGVERAGLSVTLDMAKAPASLPSSVTHAGFRIVQEGLTNVLRHSTDTRPFVRVAWDVDAVLFEVIDAGRTTRTLSEPVGHGLQGMKERAAALGGICHAGPGEDGGWQVRARIPVPSAAR
jgi:signal transduction histidine kinase